MDVTEVLSNARKLIAQPRGWVQGAAARDKAGADVTFTDPSACSFCAVGAIAFACWEAGLPDCSGIEGQALERVRRAAGVTGVVEWNDAEGRTVEEVVAAFDKAIASLS